MIKYRIFAILAFFSLSVCHAQTTDEKPDFRQSAEKITALLYHLDNSYVDSVDLHRVVDETIREVLNELDPHSVYIPAEEVQRANEGLEGNFEGIGIQFNILKDTITVVAPIPGGPSETLGIMAGDKIVTIDGENVAGVGITNNDVTSSLRGAKGTEVSVGIRRRGSNKNLNFDIVRDKIPLYSLDASYMATDKVGYIKLNRFSKTTMDEFHEAIKELKAQGMEDLILDLQSNGGGLLETSRQLADEFLSAGQLIVYTEGRSYPRREMIASSEGEFEEGRLIILTNEGSASASEIVSGAVQDWDRGLIVGRRSFGKGLVQRPIPLPDGSYVRLTTQKYFTPSGRCIQKPYDDGLEAYYSEKYERYEKGEMWSLDSLDFPDSLKYYTKNNRVVYGGGGIVPDVFVPLDTTEGSDLNTDLIRTGVMNSFAITYTNKNRKKLMKEYPDVSSYIEGFDMDEVMVELKDYAADEEIEWDEEQYLRSEKMIKGRVKALIARNLWDYSAYYQVFNPYWDTFNRAVEILENDLYGEFKLAEHRF
jgi:carboxyl-terminal processing protease